MIGSLALTVPAAVWLYGQGPQKGVHHPEAAHSEREAGAKDKEEPAEEASEAKPGETAPSKGSAQDPEDEKASTKERKSKQEGGSDESTSDSDESKDDSSDESSDNEPSDKGKGSPNAPGQINYKPESGKGPGEGQKGPRPPPELKGEKDAAKDKSGAQNPYLENHQEKSKKGEGLVDTMKIHGTVDSNRPIRGPNTDSKAKKE